MKDLGWFSKSSSVDFFLRVVDRVRMLRSGEGVMGSDLMGLGMNGDGRGFGQKNNDKIFEFKSIKQAKITSIDLDPKE
jgi:hypothetical protein